MDSQLHLGIQISQIDKSKRQFLSYNLGKVVRILHAIKWILLRQLLMNKPGEKQEKDEDVILFSSNFI